MERIFSAYPELAGQTVKWLPSDTQERYNKHMQMSMQKQMLQDLGWNENSITYTFNQQGFRSDTFADDWPSIVFLGCSHTVGIGLPYDDVFATIVSRTLKMNSYNLGVGGGTNGSAFRFAYHWIEKLKPKVVVYLETSATRLEIFNKHNVEYLIANNFNRKYQGFFSDWVTNEENTTLDREKNVLAIQHICANNNVKFILDNMIMMTDNRDLARDLMHPGKNLHKKKAKQILEKIDGN